MSSEFFTQHAKHKRRNFKIKAFWIIFKTFCVHPILFDRIRKILVIIILLLYRITDLMIISANNTSSILIFDKISKLTYTLEKL